MLAHAGALDDERLLSTVEEALRTGLVCEDAARWPNSPSRRRPSTSAAGERALAKLAFEAAAVHFECALQSLALAGNDPEARAGLEHALAEARELAGGAELTPTP